MRHLHGQYTLISHIIQIIPDAPAQVVGTGVLLTSSETDAYFSGLERSPFHERLSVSVGRRKET